MNPKPTVLIVDDEERFRHNLAKLLAANGVPSLQAADGPQALQILGSDHVDVVLLDLFMPKIGGQATLERMRELGLDQPVIVLTGHASVDAAVELLNLGAMDYLLKPCKTELLLQKIALAFEGAQLAAERSEGASM